MDKEVFNDTERRKIREVDLVVETKLKGEASLVLVHLEQQPQYEPEFNERMFLYFSRLVEANPGKSIIPIALFSYDDKNKQESSIYTMRFPFLNVLEFNFLTVELNKLNWRNFIHRDNPLAGTLMSKMDYNDVDKIEIKKEFLRILVRSELDAAHNHELTTFFETYLKLTNEEENKLQEEVTQLNPEEEAKVMELMTSYERKGMEKGIKKVALNLLYEGMDVQKVIELTDLTEKEVKELKEQQNKNK
ncbi:DUF4351 domain-containing protein [Salinicoccus sp. YB14-2]|uniref:DUF4351 domain-containing protein n=1 Tax=Salinicoccus sp. YB14-2 TaxID=1572701 RepID=UPI000A554FE1